MFTPSVMLLRLGATHLRAGKIHFSISQASSREYELKNIDQLRLSDELIAAKRRDNCDKVLCKAHQASPEIAGNPFPFWHDMKVLSEI